MNCKRLACIFVLAVCAPLFAKEVTNGAFVFDGSEGQKKVFGLNGDWEFYRNQTFISLMGANLKVDFMEVPSSWSRRSFDDEPLSPYGSHTYRVLITGLRPNFEYAIFSRKSPHYAANFYANGRFLGSTGTFARHAKDCKSAQEPIFYGMTSTESGVIELVVQVSNFTGGASGIASPILFGEFGATEEFFQKVSAVVALILGGLFFCFLSNFLLWMFDRTRRANLFFALLILFIALRAALNDLNAFSLAGINIPFALQFKLENAIIFAPCIFSLLYAVDKSFAARFPLADKLFSSISAALFIIFVCLPTSFSVPLLWIPIAWGLLFALYSLVRMALALKNSQMVAAAYMAFYAMMAIPIALDNLIPRLLNERVANLPEIFTFILVACNIAYIAAILEIQQKNDSAAKTELSKFYFAYRRFVPQRMVELFDKKNVSELKIGVSNECQMTIMFVGLDVVSPDNTKINLREKFETLDFYSARVIDKIQIAGGSVVSITKQGLAILFKGGAAEALQAAKAIRNELQVINVRRAEDYYLCANFNVSIHSGDILVGVIGDRDRIDFTIISSGVEVVDKMSALGFAMKIPVLISQAASETLAPEALKDLKLLGNIHFSEFARPIGLYGFLSSEEEEDALDGADGNPVITQREADKYLNL